MAKRIENVLPKLVHSDQTGFMKGRYIGENMRFIYDLMEHTMAQKKAFDTTKWVGIFYADIESVVMNNGF